MPNKYVIHKDGNPVEVVAPGISFIIPARNEAEGIGRTIEYILKQPEHLVKEIIVADNGSTDRTREIASGYPKTRVISVPTPGTNRARQAGVDASSGEIVAFLDADNWPTANWSATAIHYLKKPGVVAVAGIYDYRDMNEFSRYLSILGFLVISYPVYLLVHYILKRGSVVQGGNLAVRREALEKIGGLDVNYTFFGDDVKTGKQLRKIGRVIFAPDLIVRSSARRFRKHGYVKTIFRYFINFAWVILFDRPFTK